MKKAVRYLQDLMLGWGALVLFLVLSFLPVAMSAQGVAGQNTVYNWNASTSTLSPTGSSSFTDASQLPSGASPTLCSTIYGILSASSYVPGVIDARNIPSTSISMTCASGSTPWNNGSGILNVASTILLPPGVINITSPWILPANTRLIGEGDGIFPSSATTTPGSIIRASTSMTSGNYMIQFGSSASGPPTGISVENLVLDGQGQSIGGIENQYAQDQSYVDHVGLYQIRGTGLLITGSAENSGPYKNIVFDTGGFSGVSSTVCAQILSVGGNTHGIHGINCKSEGNDPAAAILVDSSGNSVEDALITGFYDGILVGSNAAAPGNVLINIVGDTSVTTSLTPVNTVHISSTVHDLSIMGVSNSGLSNTYTIEDDATSTHLSDATVAIYALGRSSGPGISRFTTSKSVPTWAVGSNTPSSTSCSRGSLYSCTGGGSGSSCESSSTYYALWACALLSGSSTPQWLPVL